MSVLSPITQPLVELMAAAPRGPKREGLFALWLTVRLIEDLTLAPSLPDRALRRRAGLLERRLATMALPPPLRRGLSATIRDLKAPGRDDPRTLFATLVGPVRDGIGPDAAEVVRRAARTG